MERIATLLYVDDEIINLKIFEINFKGRFEVITALSGYAGLEKLHENSDISIVISDMKMPGMNGIEFIRKAKELYPNVIFYILTGYDITEEIRTALHNKVIHRYFKKPFNVLEIEANIRQAIEDSGVV